MTSEVSIFKPNADAVQEKLNKSLLVIVAAHTDGVGDITISERLREFATNADNAFQQAERAVIDSVERLGTGADLIKIIGNQVKVLDPTRKVLTSPADAYKKTVMEFFGIPLARLESAKTLISDKCSKFRAKESARLADEARILRESAEAEALANAQAAHDLGGTAAADAVIDGAVTAISAIEPERVKATGGYGATFVETYRYHGEVTNTREFLGWLANEADNTKINEILVGFSKRGLNNLAAEATEKKLVIPGFAGKKVSVDRVA